MEGIATDKNLLVFYSNSNSKSLNDAKGAFIPEAEAFKRLHKIPNENFIGMNLVGINKIKQKNRNKVLDVIDNFDRNKKLDGLFFFGHGWPNGIQFGFDRNNIPELTEAMAEKCSNDVKIGIYACLTAENDIRDKDYGNVGIGTDGGFADLFRDDLVRKGINYGWVDAHKTAGHTSYNPFLVRFLCEDVSDISCGAEGGAWIVAPRSQLWRKWVNALQSKEKDSLRFRFPFMTELEIKNELMKAA